MKITLEITRDQLRAFKRIGNQLRATPEEMILSCACSYLEIDREDQVEQLSADLLLYSVNKVTPNAENIWQFLEFPEDAETKVQPEAMTA